MDVTLRINKAALDLTENTMLKKTFQQTQREILKFRGFAWKSLLIKWFAIQFINILKIMSSYILKTKHYRHFL